MNRPATIAVGLMLGAACGSLIPLPSPKATTAASATTRHTLADRRAGGGLPTGSPRPVADESSDTVPGAPRTGVFAPDFSITPEASLIYGLSADALAAIQRATATTGRRAYQDRIDRAAVLTEADDNVMIAASRNPHLAAQLDAELQAALAGNGLPAQLAATDDYQRWFHTLTGGLRHEDVSYLVRPAPETGAADGQFMFITVHAQPGALPVTSVRHFSQVTELPAFERALLDRHLPSGFRTRNGL